MDRQQLLPFGEFELDDGCHDLDAGVADEDIQRAKRLDDFRGARLHLCFVADIHCHADRPLAVRIDLARGGIGRLLVQIGDGDPGPFAGKDDGDLPADSAGCAGDDGDFVLQTHGALLSGTSANSHAR